MVICSNRTALLILLKGWKRNRKSYCKTDKFIIRKNASYVYMVVDFVAASIAEALILKGKSKGRGEMLFAVICSKVAFEFFR